MLRVCLPNRRFKGGDSCVAPSIMRSLAIECPVGAPLQHVLLLTSPSAISIGCSNPSKKLWLQLSLSSLFFLISPARIFDLSAGSRGKGEDLQQPVVQVTQPTHCHRRHMSPFVAS